MNGKAKSRGFVLINALVLVAALASVAVFLLNRAEQGRARLGQSRTAAQLSLNLDAFEALSIVQLTNSADGGPDHFKRLWGRQTYDMPLTHGRVSGRIQDLNGLFNVNWLADPENYSAHAAFDRLRTRLGVSEKDAATLVDLLRPGGPDDARPFARLDPPENPVGGALMMLPQLDRMPGLSARTRNLLRPYLTALPGNSKLNPNTADPLVLAAFLPDLPPAALDQILIDRQREPFTSVDTFLATVGLTLPDDDADPEDMDPEIIRAYQLGISSEWFRADIASALGDHTARRTTVFQRSGVPPQTRVIWRMTTTP